jgi:anaerobic selenocysteine-containing dehydrogenase
MRQGQLGGRGFLIQIEPRLSATGACADEWIPVRPGTESDLALGIGRIIIEENLGRVGNYREFAGLYGDVDVRQVAAASGFSVEELQRLARIFANAERPLAIPGGYLTGHSHGPGALDAVMALNVIMRRLGREGGVFFTQEPPSESLSAPVSPSSYHDVNQLVERMKAGEVEILLIHSTNPAYDLPGQRGFVEALENVPLVVSFSPFVDETAVQADLILPDHTYLEGWGSLAISNGVDRPTIGSQQPVARPLYDTRSTADVFLTLASKLGGEIQAAIPWTDEVSYLEEISTTLIGSPIGLYDARTERGFWSRWRQVGGWWSENPIRKEPEITRSLTLQLNTDPAEFLGDAGTYPFYLMPYESVTLSDGRGANQPWLQETPDPMTTAQWNTWVEINPVTAEHLGLEDNDVVRIRSPYGELEASVVLFPGIRPDVIAIPTGQGHTDLGRFAMDRGANVMQLIAPAPGGMEGQLTWGATRVSVEPIGKVKQIARLESLDGEGRENLR